MKNDKVTSHLKKLTHRVDAFTHLVKACARLLREMGVALLPLYGLLEFLLRHLPK